MGINTKLYKHNLQRFTKKSPNHLKNENSFGGFFKWKLNIENNYIHILDDNYIEETYNRLYKILPSWRVYRPYKFEDCFQRLKKSLKKISDAYNQIREFSLLEFSKIPTDSLKLIWDELGCVKEENAKKNLEKNS